MDAQSPLQSEIEQLVGAHGRDRTALMPVLQELNRSHSYLSEEAMMIVSKELRVRKNRIFCGSIHHIHHFDYDELGGVRIIF